MEKEIIKSEDPKPVKTIKCLNCGAEFEGNFCPECGQRADTGRFTVRFIFENLLKAILSNDGGVWITLKSLFTHPGQMMVDIINGKRKSYFSPFPMLFLTLSLYVIIFTFTGSNKTNYDELYANDDKKEIIKEYNTATDSDASIDIDDSNHKTHTYDVNVDIDDEKTELVENTAKRCLKFYENNYTIVFILTIPFYIFAARVCYGKKNRKRYNRGEYCIPIIYSLIIVVLYQCLTSIAYYFSDMLYDKMDNLNPLVTIAAFTACFRKMMEFSVVKMAWRSFLAHVFYYVVIVVIVIFAAIVYFTCLYLF